jgi:phosphoglycerate dehydrogenase-like enzyme
VARRVVVDLQSVRPVWRVPPATVGAVRRAFGAGFEIVDVQAPTSSDGDGGSGSPEAIQAAGGAEVYVGWGVPRGVAKAGRGTLRWAHSGSAGVGSSLSPEFLATGARLTNSRGINAEPMADWVVAAIGYCVRGFHTAAAAQRGRRWVKDEFTDGRVAVREFAGTRIGLVGLGGVGAAVARRCAALGMDVSAVRRRPGRARPRGVRRVGGPGIAALLAMARRVDILVIAAPHTPLTKGVVNDAVLGALPRGAFVINVARGALLDERALLTRLDEGQLGGCVLDVVADEPLPPSHQFWTHPRVLLTPHVSAVSQRFWERETALLVDNIRRYRSGRRLVNLVDVNAGY